MESDKSCGGRRSSHKSKFTAEEDDKLKALVREFGVNCWSLISKHIAGRRPRQCRDRWKHYLSQEMVTTTWTEDEDMVLMHYYHEYGAKWSLISRFFPDRNPVVVRNRCCKLLRRNKEKTIIEEPVNKIEETKQIKHVFPSCDSLPFPYIEQIRITPMLVFPFGND